MRKKLIMFAAIVFILIFSMAYYVMDRKQSMSSQIDNSFKSVNYPSENGAFFNNISFNSTNIADLTMIKDDKNVYYAYGTRDNDDGELRGYYSTNSKNWTEFTVSITGIPSHNGGAAYDYLWAPDIFKIVINENGTNVTYYYLLFTAIIWGNGYPDKNGSFGTVYYARTKDLSSGSFTYMGEMPYGRGYLVDKVGKFPDGNPNLNHIDGSLLFDGSKIYHYFKLDNRDEKSDYQSQGVYCQEVSLYSNGTFYGVGNPYAVMRRNTESDPIDSNRFSWHNWQDNNYNADWENINEGPYVIKRNEKYYLTYSVGEYTNNTYHTVVATSNSATGPFFRDKLTTKNSLNENQYGIRPFTKGLHHLSKDISIDNSNSYIYGPGHGAILTISQNDSILGDYNDYYYVYHSNIYENGEWKRRKMTIDEVDFTSSNTKVANTMVANAPTWNNQPLISGSTYNGTTYYKVPTSKYNVQVDGVNKSVLSDGVRNEISTEDVSSSISTNSIRIKTINKERIKLSDIWIYGNSNLGNESGTVSGTVTFNPDSNAVTTMNFNLNASGKNLKIQVPMNIEGYINDIQIVFNSSISITEVSLIRTTKDNNYKVTFDHNGGNVNKANNFGGNAFTDNNNLLTYMEGDTKPSLLLTHRKTYFNDLSNDKPNRSNYHFKGWATAASGGTLVFNSDGRSNPNATSYWNASGEWIRTGDVTLYAQWEGVQSTVSFNANGGSVSPTSKSVTYNATYGDLPTPKRDGYTFAGWYTNPTNGTKFTSSTVVTANSNHTLYAHWNLCNACQPGTGANCSMSVSNNTCTYATSCKTGYGNITNNGKYNPSCTANIYTVTLNANGGSGGTGSINIAYGTAASNYPGIIRPTKTNSVFNGFYTTTSGGTQYYNKDGVSVRNFDLTSNTTWYAQWSDCAACRPGTGANCSLSVSNNTCTYATSCKTGYSNISNNGKYNPSCTANTYTVSFNANGGSVSQTSKSVTYNATYGDLPTPTRNGYTFVGWYTAASGGANVVNTTSVTVTTAQTLYAHWSPIEYKLTLTKNTGIKNIYYKIGTSPTYTKVTNSTTVNVAMDVSYSLYAEADTGYTYSEYSSTKTLAGTMTTSGYTYSPVATANTYTVSFNANGGSVSQTSKSVTYTTTYGDLPTPTRIGYVFAGWFTEVNCVNQVTSNTVMINPSNHTLYARWNANNNKLNIVKNIGIKEIYYKVGIASTYTKATSSTSVDVSTDVSYSLYAVAEDGYTYNAYSSSSPLNGVMGASGFIYSPEATANTYTVSFNANGGSVSQTSKSVTYNSIYGDLPTPTRNGYTFVGWYTAASGGVEVNNSSIVKITSAQTLYAHWVSNSYNVVFNPNGGSVSGEGKNVLMGQKFGDLPLPTRNGYTFNGWYTEVNGGTIITKDSIVSSANNIILYAHWTANKYSVSFTLEDGEVLGTLEVTYGSRYGNLPSKDKKGYSLTGWYIGDKLITSDSIVDLTKDSVAVSKWTANKYKVTLNPTGGQVDKDEITVTYDSEYSDLVDPIRSGYIFEGWYTDENASGEMITSKTKVTITSNQVLYARWRKIDSKYSYEITFVTNTIFNIKNFNDYIIVIDGDYDKFIKIEIADLDLIKNKDYKVTKGSTIIDITDNGINKLLTLPVGEYELRVVYEDDIVVSSKIILTDQKVDVPDNVYKKDDIISNPKTGIEEKFVLILILIATTVFMYYVSRRYNFFRKI